MATIKLTLGGVLIGAQRWSVGVNLDAANTAPAAGDLSTFATQAFTDFNTTAWSTVTAGAIALRTMAGASSNLSQVRAYYYPTGSAVATRIGASTNTAVAGTGNQNMPAQCAVVASLLTGVAGRSNRGRIYLPALSCGLASSGLLSTPNPSQIATSVANWLSLLRTRTIPGVGSPLTPIVKSSTGLSYQVNAVRVDNVVDTQRRRRDNLVADNTQTVAVIVG